MTKAIPSSSNGSGQYRLGCDTGGTFTDFVLLDPASGQIWVEKVLTTPERPSQAVFQGIDRFQESIRDCARNTEFLIYGTTLVINALVERRGANAALLTTRGFRDVLELRRASRGDLWDLSGRLPEPIIPRRMRYEIDERLWHDGQIFTPLDELQVRQLAEEIKRQGVNSVAVCLIHSYSNPIHEQQVHGILADAMPDLHISLSSEVLPEIKEYERTVATAVNAYVAPVIAQHIPEIQQGLDGREMDATLRLMMSEGSVTSAETAARFPIRLTESGPVGGILAAKLLADTLCIDHAIAYDMGGTTAKTALVEDGRLPITSEYEIARVYRFKPGSGLPLNIPTVDILEVGAGGGSIASVNQMGLLQVGPESAGANPGPACYGLGGNRPTVTDADLLLGYLDPDYFLGGTMAINDVAARRAIDRHVAKPLSISIEEAARRIVNLTNEMMATAIRLQIAQRGGDPASYALIAYGGAGPVHASAVASRLGVAKVIVPPHAGVMSALGFVAASPAFRSTQTYRQPLPDIDSDRLAADLQTMARRAIQLAGETIVGKDPRREYWARMRYVGQGYEIRVPLNGRLEPSELQERFDERYARLYGYSYPEQTIEVVALEVIVANRARRSNWTFGGTEYHTSNDPLKGTRMAFSPESNSLVSHAVYDRYALSPGETFVGPAIIEERESTFIIEANSRVSVDALKNLVVER